MFAHIVRGPKFISVAMLSLFLGGANASLFVRSAVANEMPRIETFKESNAINGILCIAACNEFFEAGQATFELEIRNLQSRVVRPEESPVLQVDPNLVKVLEEQREAESRQNI